MDDTTSQAANSPLGSEPLPLQEELVQSVQSFVNGNYVEASSELALRVIVPGVCALLAVVVTYFVAKLLARWVATAVCQRIDKTIGKFAGKLTFYSVFTIAALAILDYFSISVAGIAAVIAAAGFAIGLAFQGTLSNFSAGILLLVFRPFKVGDFVNTAGVMGKVNEIDLFTTTLDTPDNRRLILPNSSIAGSTIENISFHKQRRVDVVVGVAYSASLDETRRILTASAESLQEKIVHGEGRGYQILLSTLGAHSVEWTVRVWAASSDFFAVKESLTSEIKRQLDAHGIEIPFPQMQLHFPEHGSSTHAMGSGQRSLPIPKMNTAVPEHRTPRVRPRARGESSGA